MNQRRVFALINTALILIGAMMIYYLATAEEGKPREIDLAFTALELLETADGDGAPAQSAPDPSEAWKSLGEANFARVLFTMTPTPTPTPRKTPTPLTLTQMLAPWKIRSLSGNSVTIFDEKTKEGFELILNGEARSVELSGQTMNVKLCGINLAANPPEIELCSGDKKVTKRL